MTNHHHRQNLIANTLLITLGLLMVFHILVIVGFLPPDIVWGGNVGDSPENLLTMELISIFVTLLFMLVIAAKAGYILKGELSKIVNVGVWVIAIYFALNIMGNLSSSSTIEKLIFTPIAIILSALSFTLALKK